MEQPEPLITTLADVEHEPAHASAPRAAVLMVNLGTPEAPTARALRPYLREFLSDRRVIELPRAVWWCILNGIILPFRAPRSARAYARIWTEHGSPLLVTSRALAGAVEQALQTTLPKVRVMLAMNYGQPSIERALSGLRAANIQRLLVLPLYPQYSATTTASVFDRVSRTLERIRWLPEFRFITHYHDDPAWQDTVADSITTYQDKHGSPERLVFSFHGIPRRNLMAGDPYYCQCQASARRIAERLELDRRDWIVTFQSRLGRAEWLRPYTDETLRALAREGVGRVQVICPGFAVDCLETLDEIAHENREAFLAAGGRSLDYIPCLNDSPHHAHMLAALCRRHGQGWPEFEGRSAIGSSELDSRRRRAVRAAEQLGSL